MCQDWRRRPGSCPTPPRWRNCSIHSASAARISHQQEERPDVRRRPDGSYLVEGTVTVRDLNRELDWNLPDEGATTVAGLVIQEAQTIPDPGQRFAFFGYKFEVLRRQRNQITALKIIQPQKAEASN